MPVTEAMTAFDPKPKFTTDRYQVVQITDAIKIKATFPSRQKNTSMIGYFLAPRVLGRSPHVAVYMLRQINPARRDIY